MELDSTLGVKAARRNGGVASQFRSLPPLGIGKSVSVGRFFLLVGGNLSGLLP